MRTLLVVAGLLGGAAPLFSQISVSPYFADSLVVTASLEAEPAKRSSASVHVIEAEEIAARQATGVADLLATVPGVTILRSGSAGKVTSLFSRGTESDHTLVLWNGVELNNPFFGGFDWAFLPTDGVERVEVVRGPFSSVHGSDAIGGVVQILTAEESGGTLRLEGGGREYHRGSISAGRATERWKLSVIGASRHGEEESQNDFFDSHEAALNARWSPREALTVGLVARGNESENGIPFSGGLPSLERTISWRERQVAIPATIATDAWEIDASVSHVAYDTLFVDPEDAFGFTEARTESESRRARVSATRRFGDSSWVAFGGEMERLEVDDRSIFGVNLDGAGQTTRSIFAQMAHDLGAARIDLGARHDDNDAFGSRTTPRLGFSLALGDATRLRASWGQGFRAPSIGELFYPFSGNAALQPETSESGELGIEHRAGGWQWGAAAFENRIRNLIDFDFVSFTNRNVGRARSRGIEVWGRYAGRLVTASATATGLSAEDETTGERLLRRPERSASLIVTASPGPWTLNLSAVHVGKRPDIDPGTLARIDLPAHTRFDLGARYSAWKRFEPYGRVENAGDRSYQAVAGFPAPRRSWIGGLAVTWK